MNLPARGRRSSGTIMRAAACCVILFFGAGRVFRQLRAAHQFANSIHCCVSPIFPPDRCCHLRPSFTRQLTVFERASARARVTPREKQFRIHIANSATSWHVRLSVCCATIEFANHERSTLLVRCTARWANVQLRRRGCLHVARATLEPRSVDIIGGSSAIVRGEENPVEDRPTWRRVTGATCPHERCSLPLLLFPPRLFASRWARIVTLRG